MPPTNKQTPALKHLHFTNLLLITVTPFLTTFFLTTLPITQSIQVVNPSVNCEGDAVVFNFDYDIDITLANLYIGSCNAETSDRITTSKEGANSHIIEIHQNSGCEDSQNVDANNVTSYNKYYTVEFEAKLTGPGLIIKNHQLTVVCYYQEEYQVDLEFGQLEMETQRGDGVENEAIHFHFIQYEDENFSSAMNASEESVLEAGKMGFFKIYTSDPMYDENVMNYAIRSCSVQELNSGLAFTMYDFSNNQDCGNSAIHFSVTEDLEMGGWKISYLFFLFQNIEVVNYQLHCSVTLCSNSNSASKCNEIKQVCG